MKMQIVEHIKEIIENSTSMIFNSEREYFECEIYADYNDEISYDNVNEWLKQSNPREAFFESLYEWYSDSETELREDIYRRVKSHWKLDSCPYDEHSELIEDWISDHIAFILPEKHFLRQKICVDIIVDTGDENYDYVCNDMYPHYNARYNDTVQEEASILWLIRQQGYTKRQLNNALRKCEFSNSKLLKSVRTEVHNCSSHMNALTFFVEMTLEQLFGLHEAIKDNSKSDPPLKEGEYRCVWERKGRKTITIDKSVVCGLYDTWNGAGSVFDIELEKDVTLPLRYISSALPDGCRGCSVARVYGVCASMWTPALKKLA